MLATFSLPLNLKLNLPLIIGALATLSREITTWSFTKSTCAGDDEAVERSWKHTAVASTQASSQTGMGHFMTQDATQGRAGG